MKKIMFAAFVSSLLAISCKKDDSTVVPAGGGEYMTLPTDSGKTWNYQRVDPNGTTNYTLVATGRTSVISGRNYSVFRNSDGSFEEYYANSGSDYYKWEDLGLASAQYENRYLVDNLATNATWDAGTVLISLDTMGAIINASIRFRKNILNTNTQLTVNSTNYTEVKHTSTTPEVASLSINYGGLPIPGATLDVSSSYFRSYYAKKYGLISDTTTLSGTLTIPAIPPFTTTPTIVPLDNLIDIKTYFMGANF